MKVLIVDDSAIVRERLAAMFSALGDQVELVGEAHDAPGAIESIHRLKPDVVVLDIQMPRGNGMDVLRDIKKENRSPLVMVLTNYPYAQYRRACVEAGADFFFDKSTEFDWLPELFQELARYCSEERASCPRGRLHPPR